MKLRSAFFLELMIPDIHEAEKEGKKKSSQVNQDLQVMLFRLNF